MLIKTLRLGWSFKRGKDVFRQDYWLFLSDESGSVLYNSNFLADIRGNGFKKVGKTVEGLIYKRRKSYGRFKSGVVLC
jgi:hypothetical protein